jgi:hypothetical protein
MLSAEIISELVLLSLVDNLSLKSDHVERKVPKYEYHKIFPSL